MFALIILSAILTSQPQVEVCPTCQITSIAQGLSEVASGGTVLVRPGIYQETGLIIERPVRLHGEPGAIIDGNGSVDVIKINKSDDVEISGFELRNSGKSYIQEFAGIKVEDSKRCKLLDNKIHHSNFGIYLANSDDCTLSRNNISGIKGNEADTGNGIHIWHGQGHHIEGNQIDNQRDGIYFEFVTDSKIIGNLSNDNLRYGLHFMFSHRNSYLRNEFSRNGAGVAVMYSREIEMIKNKFTGNQGMAAYGLLLKEISQAKILDNEFSFDSIGIYMEGSNRSQFTGNSFNNNGWGIRILGDCDANNFSGNNFTANTFDVSTNSSNNPNTFHKNYWSQYGGYDLDDNGTGDLPYRLVSLSSIIIERTDASFSLLRSPLFSLLDHIEQALPELIPARMIDDAPLMRPAITGDAND